MSGDHAGDVLGRVPAVLPGAAFDVGAAPGEGVEGGEPRAVGVLAAEEAGLLVEEVLPVGGASLEEEGVGLVAEGAGDLGDAEVAEGCVDGLGGGLLDLEVGGDVVELEVGARCRVGRSLCRGLPGVVACFLRPG